MMKKTFAKVLPVIKRAANKVKEIVMTIENNLLKVGKKEFLKFNLILINFIKLENTIKNAFAWLSNIANMCKVEKETPLNQCLKAVEDTQASCR